MGLLCIINLILFNILVDLKESSYWLENLWLLLLDSLGLLLHFQISRDVCRMGLIFHTLFRLKYNNRLGLITMNHFFNFKFYTKIKSSSNFDWLHRPLALELFVCHVRPWKFRSIFGGDISNLPVEKLLSSSSLGIFLILFSLVVVGYAICPY